MAARRKASKTGGLAKLLLAARTIRAQARQSGDLNDLAVLVSILAALSTWRTEKRRRARAQRKQAESSGTGPG